MILSILKKFLKICTFLWMLTSARRSWVQQRYLNLSLCAQNIFSYIFCLRGRLPSLPWVFYIITLWSCSTSGSVGDAGFEPGTSALEVWCTTNEPPHLHLDICHPKAMLIQYYLTPSYSKTTSFSQWYSITRFKICMFQKSTLNFSLR